MKKFLRQRSSDATTNHDSTTASGQPQLSPGLKKSSTSRWKKSKKVVESKPQFDLACALPASDNFRTSLIMPNLSARFSMLREQDDPNSILGKASDDSVLQPRRKSRMMDYGFGGGLSDIAEVSSLRGSIRPPFALDRQDSMASEDGYNSDVMSRSRPGEGNTMFGGRQKIYKIPTSGANSSRSLGKAVYEDDIGMSAFQRHRQRERDQQTENDYRRASEDSHGFDFALEQAGSGAARDAHLRDSSPHNDSAKDLSHSPSLFSYDKKRSTTSSTARSEARSSTAATSVASQPVTSSTPSPAPTQTAAGAPPTTLERSNTKTRRLYDQGLEQNMHEQQTSAMTRLNSLHRQRTLNHGKQSPPGLQTTKSSGNLHERNPQQVYALRAQSPPLSSKLPPLNTFGSMRKHSSTNNSPLTSGPHSPLEPQYDEFNPLTHSIEPADRGKATAMGAFNKPKQAFDEDQYLERQQQLQRSNSNAVLRSKSVKKASVQHRIGQLEQERQRSGSNTPDGDGSQSKPKNADASKAYAVFQNAASQLPAKQAPSSAGESTARSQLPDTHRTFFGNIDASEDEDEDDEAAQFHQPDYGYGLYHGTWQPSILPSVSEHPALSSQKSKATLTEEDEDQEPRRLKTAASSKSLHKNATEPADVESPTLGQQAQPLNSMVHHLRSKSNQSSIYPNDDMIQPDDDIPEVPELPWNRNKSDSFSRVMDGAMERDSHHDPQAYTTSNPWDAEEGDHSPVSPIESGSRSGSEMNHRSARRSGMLFTKDSMPASRNNYYGGSESNAQDADVSSWQQELRKQHNRDASTATQQERDAFASELAARRQAIQENMKTMAQRQARSRDNSPVPASSGPFKAFGMLRAKSSRESMTALRDAPPKALRTLGATPSQPNLHSHHERHGMSSEKLRPRGNSSPRPPYSHQMPALPTPDTMPEWEPRARGDSEASRSERQHPSERNITAAMNSDARSRSNSANNAGRSRSRTGPYRDDLSKAMMEGIGTSAAGHPELSPMIGRELSPNVSPEGGSSLFDIPNDSTGSRTMTSYFDQGNLKVSTSNGCMTPGGPSPVAPSPNAFNAARPAPVANAYSQNATPPLSGASTPALPAASQGFPGIVSRPSSSLRKKTISKSDISVPTLLHATSNIDTVDLPDGASLRNGMDDAPPIPAINPKRRGTLKLFNLGRSDSSDELSSRGHTPEPHRSVSNSLGAGRLPHRGDNASSPALHQQYGSYNPSPAERVERPSPPHTSAGMDGSMF